MDQASGHDNQARRACPGEAVDSTARIVFHIGLHRTGTTFLQQQVFPKLPDWNYLRRERILDWLLRVRYQEDASFNADLMRGELGTLIDGRPTIVSDEGLSGSVFHMYVNQSRTSQRLVEMFPHARVLLVIRRQDALINSIYRRYVVAGGTKSFDSYIGYHRKERRFSAWHRSLENHVNLGMFCYDQLVSLYERLFPEKVWVVPFEVIREGADAYVSAVCNAIGAQLPGTIYPDPLNEGFTHFQVVLARWLNRLFRTSQNPNGLLPSRLPIIGRITPRRTLQQPLVRRLFGDRELIDPTASALMLEFFAESNRRLDERYSLGLTRWGYYS